MAIHCSQGDRPSARPHVRPGCKSVLAVVLLFASAWLPTLAQTPTTPTAVANPSSVKPDYTLGAGDAIRIQVFQNPDLTIETRVSENGSISYPLIGSVELGGCPSNVPRKRYRRPFSKVDSCRGPK